MNETTSSTPTEKPATIVRLTISNFLAIGADGIEIVPNKNSVTLLGRNGAGKSSVLRAIAAVLFGKSALPAMPIHHGAAKSETEIDFGDFTAAMKISPTGTVTSVKIKGVNIRSPMDFLKTSSNEILLDLVKFMRLGETAQGRRSQRATLERLVGLDMSKLDAAKKQYYDERTLINRELEQETNKLNAYPFDPTAPKEEVLVADLMTQLQSKQKELDAAIQKVRDENAAVVEFGNNVKLAKERLANLQSSIDDEQGVITRMELEISKRRQDLDVKKKQAEIGSRVIAEDEEKYSHMMLQDLSLAERQSDEAKKPIEDKIQAADTDNTKFRNNKRRREIEAVVKQKTSESESLTTKINDIDDEKKQMLSGAKFPLAGLSFNEDGILLNGLPMEQGSMAQQLKAIAAIGFAFKPRIPVALIQDASLFDSESLKEIEAIAEAASGQVWFERVASLDDKGNPIAEPFTIMIEDGAIREA